MRFTQALRTDNHTTSLVSADTGNEEIGDALAEADEVIHLQGWQSRIAEAYLNGQPRLERMHIWADAHGIDVTTDNGFHLLSLYKRDPQAEIIEQWCDHHQIQHA